MSGPNPEKVFSVVDGAAYPASFTTQSTDCGIAPGWYEMIDSLVGRFLSADGFMPHGMCYQWQPDILALHVISDGFTALAYFSISGTLLYFVRKRIDLRHNWIFLCFAIFIIACGFTHVMEIWTIWYPTYWLSGGVKLITALASVSTAILLIRYFPRALRIPSPSAMENARLDMEREVGERKRADERFRLAIEAAPTGMLLMDLSGSIVLVNAQIEKLFGYPRSELLGRPIEILVPERFRANIPDFRKGLFSAPMARAGDLYGLRKDGSEVPIEIGLNPLRTSDGEFVLSSILDVSQRLEVDRIRNEFVSTVSHELRTPLTSIRGSLGLLQSGAMGALPKKAAAMVAIAYKNSGRLVRIINDILDLSAIEAGKLMLKMSIVPLAELLQQSVEGNSGLAEKCGVRFLLEPVSADDRVMADPDRLMQVVANLLSNAAKFSLPGAEVRIRVRPGSTTMRVEVEDSGAGIPEAFKAHIFQKFAQADASATRRFEGTGLGLSIARKLMEAMGGSIGFDSIVDRGSVFYIELPRMDAAPAMLRTTQLSETAAYKVLVNFASATEVGSSAIPPRLLYVEDDEDLISVIRAALADRVEIVPARTLRDAERLLREEEFGLVILDQSLPDGDGITLVDLIAEYAGHPVPIIILSAADVPHDVYRKVAAVLIKSQVSAAQVATTILSYLTPMGP
jgi:PAS domain S-box-containing protein